MIDITHYNLKDHNTFGIEAYCDRFISFSSVEELMQVLPEIRAAEKRIIIGAGSNLLLTDDFHGLVVHPDIRGIEEEGYDHPTILRCGAGETFDDVVEYAVSKGLYGAENLSHIPGDVGASAVQNIGAYGVEARDIIFEVEAIEIETGELRYFSNDDCKFGYRQSIFKGELKDKYIITHVRYEFSDEPKLHLDFANIRKEIESRGIKVETARDMRNLIIDIRRKKLPDPKQEGNAGSFFMNPIVDEIKFQTLLWDYPNMPRYRLWDNAVKIPAAWLIEQCGWKGRTVGRAGVHQNQPLVLVNRGGATGKEIKALSEQIQADVKAKFDIDLVPEVNII